MLGRADVRALGIGVVAGVASGLLGVGGGLVLVPALVLIVGLPQRVAHGTSLAAIIPIGLVGAALYAVRGEVDLPLAALVAAGSIAGAPLGVRALHALREEVVEGLFVALALAAGIRLLLG